MRLFEQIVIYKNGPDGMSNDVNKNVREDSGQDSRGDERELFRMHTNK